MACNLDIASKYKNTPKIKNKYLRIIVNALWYVSKDTLHHDVNVPWIRNEIKELSQRCVDKMEEPLNILTTNVMKEVKATRRLKRKLTYVCWC